MMPNNTDTVQIRATCATPLHIGTGAYLTPFEYVILDNDILYRFDLVDFISAKNVLDEQEKYKMNLLLESHEVLPIRSCIYELATRDDTTKEWIRNNAVWSCIVKKNITTIYTEQITKNEQINESNLLSIDEMLKTPQGKWYIPGSSLKGAIRTALSQWEFEGMPYNRRQPDMYKKQIPVGDDPFRGLIVTDSECLKADDVTIGEFERTSASGGKDGIPSFREYIPAEKTFTFTVIVKPKIIARHTPVKIKRTRFNQRTQRNMDETAETVDCKISFSDIVEKCNSYAQEKLGTYSAYLQAMIDHPDSTSEVAEALLASLEAKKKVIDGLLEKLQKNIDTKTMDEFLLSVGSGGGFLFKTLSKAEFDKTNAVKTTPVTLFHPHYDRANQTWKQNTKGDYLVKAFHTDDPATEIQAPRTYWRTDEEPLGFVWCKKIT